MNKKSNQAGAVAYIKGSSENPNLYGEIRFFQRKMGVLVVANIFGLPSDNKTGFFGFHIHEGNSCSGEDFSQTGSHYDVNDNPHPNHNGDLPPLLSCEGRAYLAVLTNRFKIKDIIGRTAVIHDNPDDFYSQPSGNAGEKIACGVIKKV